MHIKELIKNLKEIEKYNPSASVYLVSDFGNEDYTTYVDFTGFSSDDNNDIQLYAVDSDTLA
jgi:hypothetical protein